MKKLTSILSAILIITSAVSSNVYAVETENPDLYALASSLGADTDHLNIFNYAHDDSERPLNWDYFDEFYKNCPNTDGMGAEKNYKISGESGSGLGISLIEILSHNGIIKPSDIVSGAETLSEISFCDSADRYITLYNVIQEHFEFLAYYRYKLRYIKENYEKQVDELITMAEKNMSDNRYFLAMVQCMNDGIENNVVPFVCIGVTNGKWEYEGKIYDKCILALDSNIVNKNTGEVKGFDENACIYINSETKEIYIPYYNEMYEEIYVIGIDDDTILNYKGPINSSSETKEDLSEYISVSGYKRHGMDYDFEVVSEDGSIRKTKNGIDKATKLRVTSTLVEPEKYYIWCSEVNLRNSKGAEILLSNKDSVYEIEQGKYIINADDEFLYYYHLYFNEGYYNFAPFYNWNFNGTVNDDITLEVTDNGIILKSSSNTIKNNLYTLRYEKGESGYVTKWQADMKTLVFTSINDVMVSMDKNGKLQLSIDPDKDGVYDVFIQKGDANGDGIIDATDASAVLTTYAMNSTENGEWNYITEDFGDFNNDGVLDATDASAILSYYANSSVEN